MIKAIRMLLINWGLTSDDSGTSPIISDIAIIAKPILNACPTRRIVPVVAEANPYSCLLTELIITLVLGDENMPKPNPIKANMQKI